MGSLVKDTGMRTAIGLSLLLFAVLALPVSLQAQDTPDVTDAMLKCREIDRNKARLRCFDQALDEAFGQDEEIEERREASFGLPDEETADADALVAMISEVKRDPKYGTTLIALDNGQVWQATSSGNLRRGIRVGRQATISSGAFGSFRLTVEGSKGFRGVKRIR